MNTKKRIWEHWWAINEKYHHLYLKNYNCMSQNLCSEEQVEGFRCACIKRSRIKKCTWYHLFIMISSLQLQMILTIQKAEYYTRLQFQKSRSGRNGSKVPKILHSFRDKMAAAIFSKFAGYWRFECWTTKSVTLVGQGKEKITVAEYFWKCWAGNWRQNTSCFFACVQRLLCRCQCAQQFKPLIRTDSSQSSSSQTDLVRVQTARCKICRISGKMQRTCNVSRFDEKFNVKSAKSLSVVTTVKLSERFAITANDNSRISQFFMPSLVEHIFAEILNTFNVISTSQEVLNLQ